MDETPYLEFDIFRVRMLKEEYEENIQFIKRELPKINWDSNKQVKEYFKKELNVALENVTISHVLSHLEKFDHDSRGFDVINGFVIYLRLKYALSNYINNILKNEINGRVLLRSFHGQWCLSNRRPLPQSPELVECIIARKGV